MASLKVEASEHPLASVTIFKSAKAEVEGNTCANCGPQFQAHLGEEGDVEIDCVGEAVRRMEEKQTGSWVNSVAADANPPKNWPASAR